MTRRLGGRAGSLLAALLATSLTACGFPGFDPEVEPMPPPADMPEAIGPIIEIGRGESLGVEWRYSIYQSTMGLCTRIEIDVSGSGESCGGSIGQSGPEPISVTSVGTGTGTPSQVEGYVAEDVAEVWIETDAGPVQATVMSLEPVDMEGGAFVALVPGNRRMGDAVAVDADGAELGRFSINAP